MQTGRICKNKRNVEATAEENGPTIDRDSLLRRKLGRVLSQPAFTSNLIKNNTATKTMAPSAAEYSQ